MHEYFAISVHFVVFYTVFNQKPWHFATFSRKIIRLSDNLGEVMITQRFHHFITRQNYLLLKTDILKRLQSSVHTFQELCSIDDCLDENNNQTDQYRT